MTSTNVARVALVNLGCRVNRVETDLIAGKLEAAGCELVSQDSADLVIVNTCAVTGEAQTKTRKAVRHAARLPQAPVVLATGCVANLFEEELRSVAPQLIVETDKGRVAARALDALGIGEDYVDDRGVLAVSPTPTGRTRPGIKIQDGCDNRCSFCIVWKARGPSTSLAPSQVLEALGEAQRRRAHEVVLTGINLGSYRAQAGDALREGARLPELLEYLLGNSSIERLRLSSIEPPDVTDDLLDVMAASGGRVAPFLHVCLQSGCDATLRRMRRVYDTAYFSAMVERCRAALPGMALETDLIVGFPGETVDEFEESYEFCKHMRFSRMHVFRYSKRPGTPAATAPGQVQPHESARRSARMRMLARDMRHEHAEAFVGREGDVIVQYPGRAVTPELFDVLVDPRIPVGELVRVRYARSQDDTLIATGVA